MAESQEDLKSLLMRVKEESEKADLKLNIQKSKRSWHLVPALPGKWKGKSGNSGRFFLGSKLTADSDCIYEIKRCLLLGRKVMTSLDSILKIRDTALLT